MGVKFFELFLHHYTSQYDLEIGHNLHQNYDNP